MPPSCNSEELSFPLVKPLRQRNFSKQPQIAPGKAVAVILPLKAFLDSLLVLVKYAAKCTGAPSSREKGTCLP